MVGNSGSQRFNDLPGPVLCGAPGTMPEGPLLILFKESLSTLTGSCVESAETKLKATSLAGLRGLRLTAMETWGKYLFLIFGEAPCHLRIHWGMFGIYTLDAPRAGKEPTAVFHFDNDRVLYLYSVSLRVMDGLPSVNDYDPRADVMSEAWDDELALEKLRALPPGTMICDALMDQTIFAGLGNAIKTEALFAQGIHPESRVEALPGAALRELVEEAIGQSQLFLEGKRAFGNERYGWVLMYRKKTCPKCGGKVSVGFTGALQRKSHWCPVCQPLRT